jgi:NADH:ubiquinone oxidoreductase subunit 6 (subunit J)
MVVAVGAVLVWLGFVIVLLTRTGTDSEQWTRLTFVFASVQALAFAAAGALFGVTVQSARVEKAERAAEENAEDAANGRALAAYTIADEETGEEALLESLPGAGAADAVRRRHAEVARRLFP